MNAVDGLVGWEADVEWGAVETAFSVLPDASSRKGRLRAKEAALQLPLAMDAMRRARDEADADEAYWLIDNVVVVQGAVYGAAVHVVPVLVRSLPYCSDLGRRSTLELLHQIVGGWDARASACPGSVARARLVVGRAVEVLYAFLLDEDWIVREKAAEILLFVEEDQDLLAHRLEWVVAHETRADTRDYLSRILREGGGSRRVGSSEADN